jgi:gamma-glutamylcyclotransferase (GGCT)/AIG2-like uncharacterized protein YtfP
MTDLLFVYGTLRPQADCAMGREARARLCSESQSLGPARTQGTLYNLGNYPALGTGSGVIVGSLYQLLDPSNTFKWLDEYEGISGAPSDEYERVLRPVVAHDEFPLRAWAYLQKRPAPRATLIPSGDWLSH